MPGGSGTTGKGGHGSAAPLNKKSFLLGAAILVAVAVSAYFFGVSSVNAPGDNQVVSADKVAPVETAAPVEPMKHAAKFAPAAAADNDPARPDIGSGTLVEIFTDVGQLWVEFYPERAPNVVAELIELIRSGYYDSGTIVESRPDIGFVISKVDANMRSFEFEEEVTGLTSRRGSIAIARPSMSPAYLNNIFVGYLKRPDLEQHYTIIGQVIKGIDTVEMAPQGKRHAVRKFRLGNEAQAVGKAKVGG